MKWVSYISLSGLVLAVILSLVNAFFPPPGSDVILAIFSKALLLWCFTGIVAWGFGFYLVASRWDERGTARSVLFLFLLFALNVFFAYYLCLSTARRKRAVQAPLD